MQINPVNNFPNQGLIMERIRSKLRLKIIRNSWTDKNIKSENPDHTISIPIYGPAEFH